MMNSMFRLICIHFVLILWSHVNDIFLLPQNQKLISPLPFYHIYAFTLSMVHCAWRGHELITSSGRFDLEEFCKAVEKYKPERTHLVPPICLGKFNVVG